MGTAVCTSLLLVMLMGNRLLWHRNTLAFLNVGQGDCAVLTTYDHRAIVIDGGGKYNKELGEILYLICDYPHKHYTFKHFEI